MNAKRSRTTKEKILWLSNNKTKIVIYAFACPIITDYGHLIMAEFDYNKNEKRSFPFSMIDMSKESRLAWLLKVYGLKPMYFYGMLNGLV